MLNLMFLVPVTARLGSGMHFPDGVPLPSDKGAVGRGDLTKTGRIVSTGRPASGGAASEVLERRSLVPVASAQAIDGSAERAFMEDPFGAHGCPPRDATRTFCREWRLEGPSVVPP